MACGTEVSDLPLLTGCPGDNERLMVCNAIGGKGDGRYALRLWSDISQCISTKGYTALSDIIAVDSPTYQNNALKGATQLSFVILNKQLYTLEDGDYAFNDVTGTIAFISITLFQNDVIIIPYKPA